MQIIKVQRLKGIQGVGLETWAHLEKVIQYIVILSYWPKTMKVAILSIL